MITGSSGKWNPWRAVSSFLGKIFTWRCCPTLDEIISLLFQLFLKLRKEKTWKSWREKEKRVNACWSMMDSVVRSSIWQIIKQKQKRIWKTERNVHHEENTREKRVKPKIHPQALIINCGSNFLILFSCLLELSFIFLKQLSSKRHYRFLKVNKPKSHFFLTLGSSLTSFSSF